MCEEDEGGIETHESGARCGHCRVRRWREGCRGARWGCSVRPKGHCREETEFDEEVFEAVGLGLDLDHPG